MSNVNRKQGRNARKKLIRQLEHYSASGSRKQTSEGLPNDANFISQAGKMFLSSCKKELAKSAVFLNAEGCWAFFERSAPEARRLKVERELLEATVQAAAKFFSAGKGSVIAKS